MATKNTSEDTKESGAAYNEDECCICHNFYQSIVEKTFLPCAHFFHKDCIDQWLAAHDSCPICRSCPNEDSVPAAATPYTASNVPDVPAAAKTTFAAMQQPQPMERCTNSFNCTGRRNCVGCYNCTNCFNCTNCLNCTNCHTCINCNNCTNCYTCTDCLNCINCQNCINCLNLIHCENTFNWADGNFNFFG